MRISIDQKTFNVILLTREMSLVGWEDILIWWFQWSNNKLKWSFSLEIISLKENKLTMDGSSSHSQRFRLNENGISNPDGKLFIFVKLTDSCMKTFETYLKQNRKSSKSVIKFNSNGGVIL